MTRKPEQEISHVYDLESDDWTTSLSASAILDDGTPFFFLGEDAHYRLAILMRNVGGVWLAHAGGRYDLLLLLRYLPTPVSITVTGSTVLAADFGGGFIVRDSFPAWLTPLKKMGAAVGIPKLEYDRSYLKNLSRAELEEYNLNDCRILRAGDILMRATFRALSMDHKWTAGSAAIEGLRKIEPLAWRAMNENRIDSHSAILAKSTAPGGLVDCAYYGRISGVYCYDVKSSYPSRYKEGPMGVGMIPATASDWDNPQANLLVRWTTKGRVDRIAPARSRFTMSGSGLCEAWITWPERMNLEPFIDKKSVVAGYKPTLTMFIGKDFAAKMFMYKEKLKIPFAKLWANSAHGKFLEDPIKESWTRKDNGGEFYAGVNLYRTDKDIFDGGLCAPHYQPVMAALVYGRARADLVRHQLAVENHGGTFLYSDTDSVHCTLSPAEMPMRLGEELGELASEGGPYDGIYLGPKMYLLHKDGEVVKIASKGVPIDRLVNGARNSDGVYYQVEKGKGEDLRLTFFEEVLKRGSAKILKDGVRSFISGARAADYHEVKRETRTVQMTYSGREETRQGPARYKHFT